MTKAQSTFAGLTTGWVIGTRIGFLVVMIGYIGVFLDFWVSPWFDHPYEWLFVMLGCAVGISALGAVLGFFGEPIQ